MPQTSWEEALSFFEEADKRHAKLVASGKETYWITNTKCLAECLINSGRKQDAKSLFLQSVDVEAISEEDKESKVIRRLAFPSYEDDVRLFKPMAYSPHCHMLT